MEHNCRDRFSLILFPLVFIISATYRTILFGERFHEPFGEHIGEFHEEHSLMKVEANWNWTLFAKKGFSMTNLTIVISLSADRIECSWFSAAEVIRARY